VLYLYESVILFGRNAYSGHRGIRLYEHGVSLVYMNIVALV